MDKDKKIFHVISNTHWDREWRFPFQKNRQMLVEMIDSLLDILDNNPDYRAFHLDSQTIVLNDYLEIRPEMRSRIEKYVREKRIFIGPWYILPDEFQVGGENLVRNLLKGHQIARSFGHVMKVGYSPFSWGQISQLPQIYSGFGVDLIMFYRGVNSLESDKAEFIWEGADGTRVLTSRFSTMPRYNFYFYIYRPVIHNEQIPEMEYRWTKGGVPFHFSDAELKDEDYHLIAPLDEYHQQNLKPAIDAIIEKQVNDFTTPHIFWAEGHDSSGPNAKTVQIIKEANEMVTPNQVIHSTLEDYARGLQETVQKDKLPTVHGERRSSQYDHRSGNMYGYTTSARMYLKQMNFTTEKWVQFYAEPFNSLAGLLGLNIKDRYLELAWDNLLQNSAHDSIGGCSLDEIHDDMVSRYKHSQEIARGVFARSMEYIARQLDLRAYPENSIHLVAVNPNTFGREEVVEAFIDIPREMDKGSLVLTDHNSQQIDVQMEGHEAVEPVLEQLIDRPLHFSMERYRCYLNLENLSAMGINSFHIQPETKTSSASSGISLGNIYEDEHVMENRWLRVKINRNGTIDILDKKNGHEFKNQAYFYDEGEAGYAWTNVPVKPFLDTQQSDAEISWKTNGPLAAVCQVKHQWNLPANLEERKNGSFSRIMPITLDYILKKHSRRVELSIRLDNPAECHRLRLMFPLALNADSSCGEGQFDVVERSTNRPDTRTWVEQPMYDYPLHQFVDVSNGSQGAAVLVDGLKEYEVLNDPQQTLAVTLFRAFKYVIQPSSVQDYSYQKGAQCLGEQTYHLAFYPHTGRWGDANVYAEALNFNNPLRLFQVGRTDGNLPANLSFLKIEPENIIFSSLKMAEAADGFILRLYNPTAETLRGKITSYLPIHKVSRVSLEEIGQEEITCLDSHHIPLVMEKKQILTLKLNFTEEVE